MNKEKIGLIAGSGQFPVLFARAARKAGVSVVAVGFVEETDPALAREVDHMYMIKLGQLGKLIDCFKKHGVTQAAMAGAINKTRLYSKIRPDWRAVRFALKLKNKKDDFLLRALASELEQDGITIKPSTVFLPGLLAPEGVLTIRQPNWKERRDIRFGWDIAKAIGKLDVGQCVVVKDQAVLAIEGIDGTDETIRRGGRLCGSGAVVVKVSKPNQDLRFDVPAVGLKTIEVMSEVKAKVLVIEAGKTLAFDLEKMIDLANQYGISIVSIRNVDKNSEQQLAEQEIEPQYIAISTPHFSYKTKPQKTPDSIKMAVIGVGYLGKFHALKLANIADVNLVALVDILPERAKLLAEELGIAHYTNYEDLAGQVDAVSIVTPTVTHFEIARFFIQRGTHVFLEKPMTTTLYEATELVKLAQEKSVILQIGHIERFNPAYRAISPLIENPLFIEVHRLSPFTERSTEIDVVLDLMIHDLDIILSITPSELKDFKASGASVLTDHADIATARLEFHNGAVANLTASRISLKALRKIRIFQKDRYLAADYGERRAYTVYRSSKNGEEVSYEELEVDGGDPLEEELKSFVKSVKSGRTPDVDGYAAKKALEIALQISETIRKNAEKFSFR